MNRFVLTAMTVGMAGCLWAAVPAMERDVSIKAAWTEGAYDWPSAYPKSTLTDWSAYDRLVLDVTNLADDGDVVTFAMKSDFTPKNDGKMSYLRAPAWETVRWEIPLVYFEDGKASITNVTKLHLYSHRPQHLAATFSGFALLMPGETPPAVKTPPALLDALRTGRADYERRMREKRAAFVRELKSANERDGVRNGKMLYGVGTGMAQVRPKTTYALDSAPALKVRLARNEWEGRQVFVTPVAEGLKGVSVGVSPLRTKGGEVFPSDAVRVSVVGYVKTVAPPRYGVGYNVPTNGAPGYVRKVKKADLGWWPDMLLDFLDRTDVAAGDVQGFWISVHASEGQPAGLYSGSVRITAANAEPIVLPFSVRVNDFTLPKTPVIPTLVSFAPGAHVAPTHQQEHKDLAKLYKDDPESPINLWNRHRLAWGDFLADHFITMAPLYHHGFDLPYDVWDRLKAQGRMGCYNLAYFSSQPFDGSEKRRRQWTQWSDWVASVIERNYATAKEHGLEKNCLVYCCDEAQTNRFPEIDAVMAKMKARFPEIPFVTTSFDDSFGTQGTLRQIDVFCPQPGKFDREIAEKSRAAGHKVWWYYACDQRAPEANSFTECQPIELRLMMGAMAAHFRPDGFLYYQCAYFNNRKCVTRGPYTDWSPRSWWNEHGDATWVAVGPGGVPLTTIRLENFRDGFEDLAYVKLVEEKSGRRVKVPETIFQSIRNYTDDPAVLEAWRDRLADYLERK